MPLVQLTSNEGIPEKDAERRNLFYDTDTQTIVSVTVLNMIDMQGIPTNDESSSFNHNLQLDDENQSQIQCAISCKSNASNESQWSEEETLALITAYERNAEKCERKWHNLQRSYKLIKDTNKKTGRGAAPKFKFYDRMDDILGSKPSNQEPNNNITCDAGLEEFNTAEEIITFDETVNTASNKSCDKQFSQTQTPKRKKKMCTSDEDGESSDSVRETSEDCSSFKSAKTSKSRTIRNSDYFHLKMDILREKEVAKKLERQLREKRHMEKMEVEKKRLELEQRKILALEKLAYQDADTTE